MPLLKPFLSFVSLLGLLRGNGALYTPSPLAYKHILYKVLSFFLSTLQDYYITLLVSCQGVFQIFLKNFFERFNIYLADVVYKLR